jgi:hypothetical protein
MILAIDQYGSKEYLKGKHPRKELKEAVGPGRIFKIYRDKKDGKTVCVGYGIGKRWFAFYTPLEKEAGQ